MTATVAALGDIVEVRGGGTPSKANQAFWNGDIPWVSPKDMKRWEIDDASDKITSEAIRESATNLIPENSILVVNRSGILKHTLPVGITRRPVAINQDIKALICNGRSHPDYIAHIVKAAEPVILKWVRATTADNFPIENLKELEIPLPALKEQRRIAAILDRADALRRKSIRALDLLDCLTQSVFQEMFGDPVKNSKELPQRPLAEIATLINGDRSSAYPKRDDLVKSGVLFLNTTNLTEQGLDLTAANYITPEKFKQLSRGKLKPGDLVITLRGTLGLSAVFDCPHDTGFINAQMMIIRPGKDICGRFLASVLQTSSMRRHLKLLGSGSAVPQLTATQMAELPIVIPKRAAQMKFVDLSNRTLAQRPRLTAFLEAGNHLFSSLQHLAFSGEL